MANSEANAWYVEESRRLLEEQQRGPSRYEPAADRSPVSERCSWS
jgi:hypothetical protein